MQVCLRPSKAFFYAASFALLGSVVCIFCSNLPLIFQCMGVIALVFYGRSIIYRDILLKSQRSVVGLVTYEDNTCLVQERAGKAYAAVLESDCCRMGFFCVLRFKDIRHVKRTCVIFKDAVDEETYRRLLILLKRAQ